MLKRHGLVVFLFCLSIILGMSLALIETVTTFFFTTGILFLAGIVTALLAAVTISWLVLKRKTHIRNPEQSVRHQGTAFGIWFALHNLTWAFIGSLFIWGMFKLFGFKPWVMIFNAAALACTCFALIGTFIIRQRKMLGLCWQSAIPAGLANFWARAGATMILRERYEYAAEHDQKQHIPLLWSISRVFNRSKAGGADRGIDLLEPRPTFLAEKFKKEWLHRFNVLLVLFWVTAALAALSGVLFASHHWDRVPGGWPADKIKAAAANQSQMMASKNSQPGNREKKSKDENKQTDREHKKQPDQGNQNNQTDQNRQKTGDIDQNDANREQERKEAQKGSSETSQDKEDSPKQESKPGESGQDSKGQAKEGQGQKQGQQGQGQEQQGQSQGQGKGQKDQGQKQGQEQGQGQQGQGRGQQGQGKSEGQGQQGKGQGQDQGQGQGQKQGQGQGQGEGQGQGQGQEQGQGQNQEQGKAQTGSAGTGIGEGQGLGDPNKPPEMLSEPERLPGIPSRATEMVSLELPTLTNAESKGSKDQENQTPADRTPSPKSKAPTTRFKPGQQERRSTKPEQYLPNWILNLIKQGKPLKTREK